MLFVALAAAACWARKRGQFDGVTTQVGKFGRSDGRFLELFVFGADGFFVLNGDLQLSAPLAYVVHLVLLIGQDCAQ